MFGLPEGNALWLMIAIFITVIFTTSSVLGLKKGAKFLSSLNAKVFIGMAIFVVIVGPRVFMIDIAFEAYGDMFSTFLDKLTITNALTTDNWARDWTVQYWASFVVVAPLIGLFYARLSKGRTIRQFILMSILGPSIFISIWISIFGGSAIFFQNTGVADIWGSIQQSGMQSTVFNVFREFPLAIPFTIIFLLTMCASLITYADPMTSVLSALSCKTIKIEDEPPRFLKLIWGVFIGSMAFILIATGGIDGVRGMFTLIGFPLIFVLALMCIATIKMARSYLDKN